MKIEKSFGSKGNIDQEKNSWIFGGVLEVTLNLERFKLIQIGIQVDLNGEWKVLATTESV